jgi:hypothetical protein
VASPIVLRGSKGGRRRAERDGNRAGKMLNFHKQF